MNYDTWINDAPDPGSSYDGHSAELLRWYFQKHVAYATAHGTLEDCFAWFMGVPGGVHLVAEARERMAEERAKLLELEMAEK